MALDPTSEEQIAAPKSGKKKLIMIILAVLIMIGGGAAYYFLVMKAKANHAESPEKEVEAAIKAPVFVILETFTVNLASDEGEQYLQVETTLQVPEDKDAKAIKEHMPEVRNRLILLLCSKMASEINTLEGKNKLSQEMMEAVKKPFTGKKEPQNVTNLFFTSFVIQ